MVRNVSALTAGHLRGARKFFSMCAACFNLYIRNFPYYYYYYYYYTIWMSLVTGIFSRYFSWTSSDPHRSGFKLHIAVLFRIMCDVPSTAVFCSESIERFPGILLLLLLKFW